MKSSGGSVVQRLSKPASAPEESRARRPALSPPTSRLGLPIIVSEAPRVLKRCLPTENDALSFPQVVSHGFEARAEQRRVLPISKSFEGRRIGVMTFAH